jgi:uroporphyrinogen decarboxylase
MNLYDRVLSRRGRMVAPLAGYPGVRLIGRPVREALRNPAVQLDALRALEDRLKPDIVFTLLDLTVEAEALGLTVDFFEKQPPVLASQVLYRAQDLLQLDMPDPERDGRMPVFLKASEELAKSGDRMCGAFVTGPFTLLAQLMGAEELLERVRREESVEEHIGFTTSVIGQYAAALSSRVDMVMVVDPAAEALKADEYRSLCAPYIKGLAGIIRSSGADCLLHICNDVSHLLEEIALTGVEGISLDSKMNLPREAEKLPSNLVLLGNIDPKRVIERGSVEDVRWEVRRLLRHMKKYRNFILSTGCDVPIGAPLRNLEAMMSEARSREGR